MLFAFDEEKNAPAFRPGRWRNSEIVVSVSPDLPVCAIRVFQKNVDLILKLPDVVLQTGDVLGHAEAASQSIRLLLDVSYPLLLLLVMASFPLSFLGV